MKTLFLNFYNQCIEIRSTENVCLSNLEEDFKYFVVPRCESKIVATFELKRENASDIKIRSIPIFKTRMCQVYGLGKARICNYDDGSVLFTTDGERRQFLILSPDVEELYEIAFTALLSVVGEALDSQGYHRAHGLGLEFNGKGILVLLPQGGGKSALASLINLPGLKIYSDETPLLHRGNLFSFPLRFALKPAVADALNIKAEGREFHRKYFDTKILFSFPADRVADPKPLSHILVGKKVKESPRISKLTRVASLGALADGMVVGRGVPQMAEFMLRLNAFGSLSMIAVSRLREAIRCSLASEAFSFEVSPDANENAKVLSDFLGRLILSKNSEK